MDKFFGAIAGIFTSGFGLLKIQKWVGKAWALYKIRKDIMKAIDQIDDLYPAGKELYDVTTDALKDKKITESEKDEIIKKARIMSKEFKEAYDSALPVWVQIRHLLK